MGRKQYDDDNLIEGIPLVTKQSKNYLNPREEIAYKGFRRELGNGGMYVGS